MFKFCVIHSKSNNFFPSIHALNRPSFIIISDVITTFLFSVDVADLKDFDDEHTDLSVIVPVDHIISWDDLDRDGKLY